MRKQKCYAGMVACIKRGEWFAKPPLGYTSKKVNRTHQLTINEEGRILKLAWEWVANEPDISQAAIVERLKTRGLSINKQHLSACLRNSFYCGRIEHSFLGGEIIEGKQEKLISPALFDRVQEILNSSNHAGYEQAAVTPRFPLKNHVRAFGHVLSGYTVKKKDLDYYKYSGKEGSVNVSAKVMHAKYAELLNEFTVPEELIPILTLVLQQKFEEKEQVRGTEVAAIKKHIATLKTEIKTVKRNYALDKIDEETYRDVVGDMNEKLRKAEAALEIATIDLSNLASYIDTTIEIACNLGTYWLERDFETCQKIQKLVFPEGVQWDAKTKNYLTDKTNLFFDNIRSLSMSYKDEKMQKKNKSCDLSSLVAGGGLEPPASGL
ncbi:MAG: recombinase family protein [Alistipes sp.]|nr:recombinase family protein [Alistipes sp.]